MLICKLHRGARAPNIVDAVWSALPSSALWLLAARGVRASTLTLGDLAGTQ